MTGAEVALLAASVVAAGASAYGVQQAGKAQEKAAEAQARQEEVNREIISDEAQRQAGQQRRETRRILARQRALSGTSGLSYSGSITDVVAETARQRELDALAIQYGAQTQRSQSRSRAGFARFEGGQARQAANIQAGASLLSSGANAYSQYYYR